MKNPVFVLRKLINLPSAGIFISVHFPMRSLEYTGTLSSTALLSPRVMKEPSSETSTILWVFFALLPFITVQKVITSFSFRVFTSSISLHMIRSPEANVGFIESVSTDIGM